MSYLGTSQDNFARDEDEQYNLGLEHAVNKTWEELQNNESGDQHRINDGIPRARRN